MPPDAILRAMAGPKRTKSSRELLTWIALKRAEFAAHVAKMRSSLNHQIKERRREIREKRDECAPYAAPATRTVQHVHAPVAHIVRRKAPKKAAKAAHRVLVIAAGKPRKAAKRGKRRAPKRRKSR